MNKKIVLGIIPQTSIETALNNFAEADFPANTISVVLADNATARKFAEDTGPLKGVTRNTLENALTTLGLEKAAIQTINREVQRSGVLLAIEVPVESVPAAQEMLADYTPVRMEVVHAHA